MDWLNQLIANPIFAIVSFLVGLVGTILAFISVKLEKKVKRLSYTTRSFNLLHDYSSRIPNAEILYAGKKIHNLRVVRIAFWNSGSETLNTSDLAEGDPLRIVIPQDSELLEKMKIIGRTNKANEVDVLEKADNTCKVTFDFLNSGDGAVIEIIQTGWSPFDFTGQIKGGGSPVFEKVEKYHYDPDASRLIQVTGRIGRRVRRIGERLDNLWRALGALMMGILFLLSYREEPNLLYLSMGIFATAGALYFIYDAFTTKYVDLPRSLEIIDKEI